MSQNTQTFLAKKHINDDLSSNGSKVDKEDHKKLFNEYNKLRNQHNELTREIDFMRDNTEARINNLNSQIESADMMTNIYKEQLLAEREKSEALVKESNKLKLELSEMQRETLNKNATIRCQESRLETANNMIQDLEGEIERQRTEIQHPFIVEPTEEQVRTNDNITHVMVRRGDYQFRARIITDENLPIGDCSFCLNVRRLIRSCCGVSICQSCYFASHSVYRNNVHIQLECDLCSNQRHRIQPRNNDVWEHEEPQQQHQQNNIVMDRQDDWDNYPINMDHFNYCYDPTSDEQLDEFFTHVTKQSFALVIDCMRNGCLSIESLKDQLQDELTEEEIRETFDFIELSGFSDRSNRVMRLHPRLNN